MESEGSALLLGHAREQLFTRLDRRLGVMIHGDSPADVVEHEHVVVDDIADMHE